jgi:hypothetical protein
MDNIYLYYSNFFHTKKLCFHPLNYFGLLRTVFFGTKIYAIVIFCFFNT